MVCSPNCVSLTTTPNASPAVPAVVFMCMDLRAWLSPINHTSIIYENRFINLLGFNILNNNKNKYPIHPPPKGGGFPG
ncbi:MAG: hypothetical protein GF329_19255 [Candidatus Lokiarchaeota archaeon]|nr:hypothetical protein [Candidatus Lokiarchaeota archaeon]